MTALAGLLRPAMSPSLVNLMLLVSAPVFLVLTVYFYLVPNVVKVELAAALPTAPSSRAARIPEDGSSPQALPAFLL